MSHADDLRMLGTRPTRRNVAGYNFPPVGPREEERIPHLETAVAALAGAIEVIGRTLDELESRPSTYA
jgi:hypothetical protein